ncbi:MAG: HEAT repeat domain-containing protein [Myxococcota bacterium]|nr:HEAT repeat domain-containing protein [Myxococcota bacterium]
MTGSGWIWLLACGPDPAVVAAGLGSENPVVREDMALIARRADSDAVVQALIRGLEDPVDEVRMRAAESLGILGDATAVVALLACLEDGNPRVRRAAIDALGVLGDERAVAPLMGLVEGAVDIPLNAIWALGELGDSRTLDLLTRLRAHEDPYVAWNAEQALEKLPAVVTAG